jgi:hypothetical protein
MEDTDFEKLDELIARTTDPKNIVKVRYLFKDKPGGQPYAYYSEERLNLGDVVKVPIRDGGEVPALVTVIDVPESEIISFKDKVKIIPAGAKLTNQPATALIDNTPDPVEIAETPLTAGEQSADNGTRFQFGRFGVFTDKPGEETIKSKKVLTTVVLNGPLIEGFKTGPDVQNVSETAVVRIAPGSDPRVMQLLNEIMRIREWSEKLVVSSEEDARKATEDLNIMSNLAKSVETTRKEYVDPLNAHVKSVNEAFKVLSEPLADADKTVREKVKAFKLLQEKKQRDAEEINRIKVELARKEASLNHGEITVDTTPVTVPLVPKITRTESGNSGLVDNWKYVVEDFSLLPNEYKIADDKVLSAIAKAHHDKKQVPGVKFYNDPGLRVYGGRKG